MNTEPKKVVTKISLNVEQTKKFLSFFVSEAFDLAKKQREQQTTVQSGS